MKFALALLLLQPWLPFGLSVDQNSTKRLQLHQDPGLPARPAPARDPKAEAPKATLKGASQSLATRMDVVVRSFCVVAVAEIFDKTWFVALICALNYGKKISFTGGFLALALHVFLAAALGVAISQFFSIRALCFSTAAVPWSTDLCNEFLRNHGDVHCFPI